MKTGLLDFVDIANFIYWTILSVQMVLGTNTIGSLGQLVPGGLAVTALFQLCLRAESVVSGEADNLKARRLMQAYYAAQETLWKYHKTGAVV